MKAKEIGKLGEKLAEDFLIKKGYKILERNYFFKIPGSFKKSEIDLIAKKEDVFVFVEVKTLKDSQILISPEEKINFQKKKKLIQTAQSWLIKNKIPLDTKWQIDVIAIRIENENPTILHFENAISDII